jgi:hypothetical protein
LAEVVETVVVAAGELFIACFGRIVCGEKR